MTTFNGHIGQDGALKIAHRKILDKWISDRKGKNIEIVFSVKRKKRSNPQNAYYWCVIVAIMFDVFREAGHNVKDAQDAHEILKAMFNTEKMVNSNGEFVEVPKSTTSNNTLEQEEYHERIRRWTAEFWGVNIPEPNEQSTLTF